MLLRVCSDMTTRRRLMLRLKASEAKPLLPLCTFMACIGTEGQIYLFLIDLFLLVFFVPNRKFITM
jgi:hypothetical protein